MLKVIAELNERRSGGHRMFMVECQCGHTFPIQKRRMKTQEFCASCAATGNKNHMRAQIKQLEQELSRYKQAYEELKLANDECVSVEFVQYQEKRNIIETLKRAAKKCEEILG